MKKMIILGLTLFLVSGCSIISKKNSDFSETINRTKLNIDLPEPIVLDEVQWLVVTEENIDAVWKMLKENNQGVALFALRHKDYEKLSLNIAEIRKQLGEYVIILKKYKKYYEGENKNG